MTGLFGFNLEENNIQCNLFPLGIEVHFFNEDAELGITIWPLQITFGLGRNRSLFKG